MKKTFLLLSILLLSTCLFAQKNRVLQQANLRDKENWGYTSSGQSLPALVLRGIKEGAITPLAIDYQKNSIQQITLSDLKKAFGIRTITKGDSAWGFAPDTAVEEMHPNNLDRLLLDVSKKKGKQQSINYITFAGQNQKNDSTVNYFSVRFQELYNFLAKQKGLYVKANNLLWKGKLPFTNGSYVTDMVTLPDTINFMGDNIELVNGANGKPGSLKFFSPYHDELFVLPIPGTDSSSKSDEVLFMHQALLERKYKIGNEIKLTTKIPPGNKIKEASLSPVPLTLLHTEAIPLNNPKNQHYFQENRELPTLLMNAAKAGKLKAFSSDSLTTELSSEEMKSRLNVKKYGINTLGLSFGEPTESESTTYFYPNALSNVRLGIKKKIDQEGNTLNQKPHSIGLAIPAERTQIGLEFVVAYFSFDQVMKVFSSDPSLAGDKAIALKMLDDLTKGQFVSYFLETSGFRVENP